MRRPRVYIASGPENGMAAELVREDFLAAGWEITHDWSWGATLVSLGEERVREVVQAEIQGIVSADVVVVVLPAGPAEHVLMGAAMVSRRPVLLVGDIPEDGRQCLAYYAHDVWRLEVMSEARVVPAVATALLPKGLQAAAGMR